MFLGTIDFYHFMPLYVVLTLGGGQNVSGKENLLVSFSRTLFHQMEWNLVWRRSSGHFGTTFEWESREMPAVYILHQKNFTVGMHPDVYEQTRFILVLMTDTTELYISVLVHVTLILFQGHGNARKQKKKTKQNKTKQTNKKKNNSANSLTIFFVDYDEFGMLLRLVGLLHLMHILSCPIRIQESESNWKDSVK